MPQKAKHLRKRADNFLKSAKNKAIDLIVSLSPRKKKRRIDDSDKENAKASTAPSDVSMNVPAADGITEDVFLATSSGGQIHAPGHFPVPYGSFFYQTSVPEVPTGAPAQFYHQYSLPLPRPVIIEEVPDDEDSDDEDDASSQLTSPSMVSLIDVPEDREDSEDITFQDAAEADPAAQDAYANASNASDASSDVPGSPDAQPDGYTRVHDAFSAPGKLREAPTIPNATAAVADLTAALRGASRGASKGYKDPKYDAFVRIRMEGMRTFLNLYVDPRSNTYGNNSACSIDTKIKSSC